MVGFALRGVAPGLVCFHPVLREALFLVRAGRFEDDVDAPPEVVENWAAVGFEAGDDFDCAFGVELAAVFCGFEHFW